MAITSRFAFFLILFSSSALGLFAQSSASVGATITTNMYQTDQNTIKLQQNQPMNAPVAYKYVDQMPAFPGDLSEFIGSHLVYPDSALKAGIEGQVILQFLVKKDGNLSDITIVKRAHPMLEKEALRLMTQMPRWMPAKNNGQVVDAMFILPIYFNPE